MTLHSNNQLTLPITLGEEGSLLNDQRPPDADHQYPDEEVTAAALPQYQVDNFLCLLVL